MSEQQKQQQNQKSISLKAFKTLIFKFCVTFSLLFYSKLFFSHLFSLLFSFQKDDRRQSKSDSFPHIGVVAPPVSIVYS